jgi:hypothetical protein
VWFQQNPESELIKVNHPSFQQGSVLISLSSFKCNPVLSSADPGLFDPDGLRQALI